jgi:Na+/alanine symporter
MGSSIGKLDATILELVGWAVSTIFFLVKLSTLLSSWMANSSETRYLHSRKWRVAMTLVVLIRMRARPFGCNQAA